MKTIIRILISIALFFVCTHICELYNIGNNSFFIGLAYCITVYGIWIDYIKWISVYDYLPIYGEEGSSDSEDVLIMLKDGTKLVGYYSYDSDTWYAYRNGPVEVIKWCEIL